MAARSLIRFFNRDVIPRWSRIRRAFHFWLAILVGITVVIQPDIAPILRMEVGDLAVAVLTYAAIAIGFGLSGALIGLTLPSLSLARSIQASKVGGFGGLSDLVFVFVWMATVHVILLLGTSFVWVLRPNDWVALGEDATIWGRVGAGFMVALGLYGSFQFLVAVTTIMSLLNVYVKFLEELGHDVESKHRG